MKVPKGLRLKGYQLGLSLEKKFSNQKQGFEPGQRISIVYDPNCL
jgi:hypothetical protein